MGKKPPQSHGCHSLMGETQLLLSGDLEMIILSEVIQRKTNIIRLHLYVESKKNGTKEFI